MNINPFSLCLVLGVLAVGARANDASSSGVGGRWRMLKSESKQVQMVREHVRIVPFGDEFQTTADFVFRNHGPATTVQMGFPESQWGVDAEGPEAFFSFRAHPTLSRFRSWVDGRLVRTRRYPSSDKVNVQALWTKTVRFARNQTRRVRVRYHSMNGGGDSSGNWWVSYNFTGGNWRGEVEESVLDVELPRGAYKWSDGVKHQISKSQRNGNRFRFRWTHWQAQENFQLTFLPIFPNDLLLHSPWASVSKTARPQYQPASSEVPRSPLLPVVRGNGAPDCVLHRGRLWVSARAFSPRWDEKRRGVILTSGKKRCFISALGATRRSSLWPLAPNGTFWISQWGNNRSLMIPARQVARGLGGRFGLDFAHAQAIFVQGKARKVLDA